MNFHISVMLSFVCQMTTPPLDMGVYSYAYMSLAAWPNAILLANNKNLSETAKTVRFRKFCMVALVGLRTFFGGLGLSAKSRIGRSNKFVFARRQRLTSNVFVV